MSAETPKIRNFKGLSGFEALAKSIRLIVNKGYGDIIELNPFDSMTVSPPDFRDLGISLIFDGAKGGAEEGEEKEETLIRKMRSAAELADLDPADVDLVLVAESGFLRSREILGKLPVSQVEGRQELAPWKGRRPDVMMDRKHGFDIGAYFVLNRELPAQALRPRRLGTILAESSFGIKPNRMGSGLLPQPLTDEVRSNNGLAKDTVLYVEQRGDLFDSESLDEAVAVYIEEELHADLGRLRTPEAKMMQASFAIQALSQVVFFAARELGSASVKENQVNSPVGRFLHSQMKKVFGEEVKNGETSLEMIRTNPGRVAAQLTAQSKLKMQYRNLLVIEEDES